MRWKVRVSSHGGWDNAAQAGPTALLGPHGGEGARRVGGVHVHCHETTAHAARLEQGVPVALRWIEFVGLQDELGFQHSAVLAAATLPQMKGQRDCAHGKAWWKVGGLRSFTQSR